MFVVRTANYVLGSSVLASLVDTYGYHRIALEEALANSSLTYGTNCKSLVSIEDFKSALKDEVSPGDLKEIEKQILRSGRPSEYIYIDMEN